MRKIKGELRMSKLKVMTKKELEAAETLRILLANLDREDKEKDKEGIKEIIKFVEDKYKKNEISPEVYVYILYALDPISGEIPVMIV